MCKICRGDMDIDLYKENNIQKAETQTDGIGQVKAEVMQKIYDKLLYHCWCIYMEENDFMSTSIYEKYERFIKDSKTHFGDCTLDAISCNRCALQQCEIEAQRLFNYLYKRK